MATRASSLMLGGIIAVIGLALLVITDASDPFDQTIISLVRDPALADPFLFLRPITELGSTGAVIVVGLLVFAVGAAIGPWRHGLIGAITIALASSGLQLTKAVVARTRPDLLEPLVVEHGFSFPSGHATLSMVAYGVLAVLISRSRLPWAAQLPIIIAIGALIVLIGVSRVWLGAHYPTDVMAGWIAGWVIVMLYASFTRRVSREPAEAAVDADPAAPRSDQPGAG